ncbi:GNAT family N-acetyltransferase [Azospirillum sp.]|uniref:GNAT family N-acetyltransferase n=1 Tax=Azospirillum sp. TaxID=34012 RepID=UPI003441F83A
MTPTMIRPATLDDVPALVELLKEFVSMSGYTALASYDPDSAAITCAALIRREDGIVFVAMDDGAVVGAVGAMSAPGPWNRSLSTVTEIFFYVSPGWRNGTGRSLLKALRDWAKNAGASVLFMGALERNDRVGCMYRRAGFTPVEQMYVGRL